MKNLLESINELLVYNKGEFIPFPDELVYLKPLPYSLISKLGIKQETLAISRRSLAHILQKGWIGRSLSFSIEKTIYKHDCIYLSNKIKNHGIRYILFKSNGIEAKNVAVVIEVNEELDYSQVITAMIADEKYITKKYKKLR